jgi:muramoyltetrapeptide carboxypeptidase
MFTPSYLNAGDTVALTCPARKISFEEIKQAIQILESWGLNVVLGKTIGLAHHQFAGNDAERAKDLQYWLNDSSIKAIISCRGGYGTVRILDSLHYDRFLISPKWVVGYSDITSLHSHLNTVMGIASLHATMPINFSTNDSFALQSLKDALFGQKLEYTFNAHELNIEGVMQGDIVGGNLSIIYSLLGTKTGISTFDKILFLEDLDEYLYHIDRMMMALKRAGKLNGLRGIIVGAMTDMKDNAIPFGKNAEEIISEHICNLGIPVCFGFPAGHIADNRAIKLGVEAKILVGKTCVFYQ